MNLATIFAFLTTALFLAFVPGPDNVFVMTQAALRGRRTGLTVVLGLCTGLIVHTTAVALGVAVIFQKSQLAFSLLKYAGSVYLIYLAWQALRTKPASSSAHAEVAASGTRFYVRGILMNLTNPKVSIFFLAFLPQFVDQRAGHVTLQLFALGGLFILATALAFGTMAVLSAGAGARFTRSVTAQKVMNRIAGAVFLGLAVKLATTER
jgi:threonine/homoserine/homoserine lactone efflux protein